jgi:predicted NAD-dependent protein-ADP-ribosyltransferase YbiA (DUF1768 family)
MDIGGGRGFPAGSLSNFQPRRFVFEGVECNSMEGLLQSFKFDKEHIQIEVCKLVGRKAKFRGKKRNKAWKRQQILWWKGEEFPRGSQEYQDLLNRAFNALAENEGFRRALLATGNAVLTHSIGSNKKSETCLTEQEFCSRLMRVREKLQKEEKGK